MERLQRLTNVRIEWLSGWCTTLVDPLTASPDSWKGTDTHS